MSDNNKQDQGERIAQLEAELAEALAENADLKRKLDVARGLTLPVNELLDLCHSVIHKPKRYADPSWRFSNITNKIKRALKALNDTAAKEEDSE